MTNLPRWGTLCAALCLLEVSGNATVFSGNAVTDGWTYQGNSVTIGDNYVRGSGAINFDVYSTALSVTSGLLTECGSVCSTWQVGDEVLGIGIVFNSSGNQQANPNLVLKWGTVGSTFSLSTIGAPGNGIGSYSGAAPLGSVLGRLNTPGASGVYYPSEESSVNVAYQKNAPNVNGVVIPDGYIAFNAIMSGGLFSSAEGLLNVTLLNNANLTGLGAFTFGGNSIATIQRGNSSTGFTDALVETFPANGVPEPSTGVLAAGALAAAWVFRRMRRGEAV